MSYVYFSFIVCGHPDMSIFFNHPSPLSFRIRPQLFSTPHLPPSLPSGRHKWMTPNVNGDIIQESKRERNPWSVA